MVTAPISVPIPKEKTALTPAPANPTADIALHLPTALSYLVLQILPGVAPISIYSSSIKSEITTRNNSSNSFSDNSFK